MEIHAGTRRALVCSEMAWRLENAAIGKDEETARVLFRAAAKCRAGVHMALADVVGERLGDRQRASQAGRP